MSWFRQKVRHHLARKYGSAGYTKRSSKRDFFANKNIVRTWAQGSRVRDSDKTKSGMVTDVQGGALKVKWDDAKEEVPVSEQEVVKTSVGQLRMDFEKGQADDVRGRSVVFKEHPKQPGQYFMIGKESLGYNEPYSWARILRGMGARELVFKNA
jgi:hypothetical protein